MPTRNYTQPSGIWDEIFTPGGRARPGLGEIAAFLKKSGMRELNRRRNDAELAIRTAGITFTVYSDGANIDREWPFDIIPRTILHKEWQRIDSAGYSLPHRENTLDSVIDGRLYSTPITDLELYTHVSATQILTNTRFKAFVNWEGKWATDQGIWTYTAGLRTQYAALNGELKIGRAHV